MKILFVCHRLPFPPKRGGKIRPFNIIRHFHEQGHQVTVGSIARTQSELQEGQGLRDFCAKLLVGSIGRYAATLQMVARLLSTSPSSMGYFYSAALHKMIRAEIASNSYDLAFVHCSSVAQYLSTANKIPSILDFGDMDSYKWLDYSAFKPQPLALGYWLEGTKLRRAERQLAGRFDMCTCTTRAELDTLDGMKAAKRTSWFPNGVDSEFFATSDDPYDKNQICFIGRMDYYPNQEAMIFFCDKVLPKIQAVRPATQLIIVGAEPSKSIRELGQRNGVRVTGTVPDVRSYVLGSALSVAPLAIARGTQNKILESMAMGVPVVCSEQAASGVDAVGGEHLLKSDSVDTYVRNIIDVLEDPKTRQRLSEAARKRVLTHHCWNASMKKMDDIVSATIEESKQ